ncbi:TRAP transporter substrate-binding protein [Cytobacillus firmus]|uniref:TRAP transporter substrate-binding protein n=1 Tax=Cytobacillus TaxID=2675230 RepID=UPI00216144F7|nr:TRAP transporter substrate-binding protein [Cytobacillus firmus]MCS0670123.1 TRAP transporter substrate-binding protein [Cytobacillus firmus]MCS0788553.1 TRAP transporter substrate-binding protein [Cytobacillus firmus]
MLKQVWTYLAVVFLLAGCSTASAGDGIAPKKIISIATVQPENHPVALGLKGFKEYIEEHLGDRYEVRIYHNGVIGGNSEALELLQMGSLDMVATSGSNLEAFANEYKIFGLPYLFNDEQSFREVMEDERFINQIYDSTLENGIQGVGWFANGVNNFYSSKKIETPEDLKGLKIRVQASEANVKMVQGFGAAAVVMAYGEVYTALQNGVIDAGTNPEMALVSMKHGEVAKHYSRTEHQIFTDMFLASTKFLDSLNEEEAKIFEKGFKLSTEVANREWDEQITKTIQEAKAMGVEFVEVDKQLFEEKQQPVKEALLNANPDLKPLYEIIHEIQNGGK